MNYICFILWVVESAREGECGYEKEVAVFAVSYEQACKTYERDTLGFKPSVTSIKDAFMTTLAGFHEAARKHAWASYIDENIDATDSVLHRPLVDSRGTVVKAGDILDCRYGFAVEAVQNPDGSFFGKLIVGEGEDDTCKDIPYSLSDTASYTVRREKK